MCGIVGIVGQNCLDNILNSMKLLEYRGYDSSGVAVIDSNGNMLLKKNVGFVENLITNLKDDYIWNSQFDIGIGHTRWATHGGVSEINAHPQYFGGFAVVHNGIISNFAKLKKEMITRGILFETETDTELFVKRLFEMNSATSVGVFVKCLSDILQEFDGNFAIALICQNFPDKIFACKKGNAPMIIGRGDALNCLASDINAINDIASEYSDLESMEIAVLSKNSVSVYRDNENVEKKFISIKICGSLFDKGHYSSFMMKEIHEQPDILSGLVEDFLCRRGHYAELQVSSFDAITLIGCGSAYYACLGARAMSERFLNKHIFVELASEFRFKNLINIEGKNLCVFVSQSGETFDTISACERAKSLGYTNYAVLNVQICTLARLCDKSIFINAGAEISVASTKAFTAQVLTLLFILLANSDEFFNLVDSSKNIQTLCEIVFNSSKDIRDIANEIAQFQNCIFLSRGDLHVIALEGALKMKELSYIHAEAIAIGELKHGSFALLDENMPVVILFSNYIGNVQSVLSTVEEILSRNAKVYVISDCDEFDVVNHLNFKSIKLPNLKSLFSPIAFAISMQLLACFCAEFRRKNVDRPRNLAKSVTVE
ncbi:glutamine--fructose-6-phosphate transaminase (isomerizing) [Candidatus Gromoviella agglomerans]|uniref:glutamine--fructose-6-phosphate transaminase (isomerizing) n=1 Tax=Candidatus Gromoviella agglomerans TaxID=2806609 RepID=UPI001E503FB7|nr:glutamine--fructose-6-phosphate transaminase (isomerizing) [Candidatus Gromoviella agglomerans]UFX98277.1 Glutamine--fructose-6-phosphate aminotransferase [Candidatus Gromoviella agglomerans]